MRKIIILPTSIFLGLIVLLVLLATVKDRVIKSAIEITSRQITGVDTVVDKFSLNIIKQSVSIKGFRLYQPESFPEGVFIDIAEISTFCKVGPLLHKKIYIPKLVLNLKEVILIKDKSGNLNVDALKIDWRGKSEKISFLIDEMVLTIDKVIYKKYGKDDKPLIKAYDIGIRDKKFENITSPEQLASKIIGTVLAPMAFKAGVKSTAVYSVAAVTGVGMIPLATGSMLFGKDHASIELDQGLQAVYETCITTIREVGEVSKEDREHWIVKGKASGCRINIKLKKTEHGKTETKVTARKLLLPKPKIAGGILHEITQNLKQ